MEGTMKRRMTILWASGLLLGAGVLGGCGSSADAETLTAAQAEMSQDPGPAGIGHFRLIREALSHVTLRPDQQIEIDKLAADAEARHADVKKAREALHAAIADQVQAGRIDRAALKPQMDALLAAVEKVRPLDRAAFVRLHDILDAKQRGAFVDAMEAAHKERMDHHGGRHGMRKWAADLNLTDAQRDQIKSALHTRFAGQREGMREQWHAVREQGKQLLESFRQDQFTLDANSPVLFSRDRIEHGAAKILDAAEAAVPVLTPEQRAAAAAKIRAGGFGH
jgi:Spy/CpxP family protein refolding chaperone